MPVTQTPWMGTVNLASANTAYQLSVLLSNLAASIKPSQVNAFVPRCQFLTLTSDQANGAAIIYIGNSNVSNSPLMAGVHLFTSQTWPIYSMDANLIRLDQIWLFSDTANVNVHVTLLTR